MTRRLCQTGLVLATLIMSAATAQGNTTAVERRGATHQRSVLVAFIHDYMDVDGFSAVPFYDVVLAVGIGQVDQKTFEISQEGVYLVSLRVHAGKGAHTDFHLQVNGANVGVVAYGEKGAFGAVDAVLKLHRDDKVTVVSTLEVRLTHKSMITIVFVAPLEEPEVHFFTGRQREEKKAGPGTLNFNVVLGQFGGFQRKSTSQFTAPQTGIYWIAIRVDPEKDASGITETWVKTERTYLLVAVGNVPVSTAAAIWLNQSTQFTVMNTGEMPTESGTIFSVVFLTFNRKPYTGSAHHLAFTGFHGADDDNKQLFQSVGLDAGGMSQRADGNARFTIKQTGVYLVSLRAMGDLTRSLVKTNDRFHHTSYTHLSSCVHVIVQQRCRGNFFE